MPRLLMDLTPLRENSQYAKLFIGFALSGIGTQLATVAIGLQVFEITGTSLGVGYVGLAALIPLVVVGLWGGAIIDSKDRRVVAAVGGIILWVGAILNLAQALLELNNEYVLYGLVAIHNVGYAIVAPARNAIYPRLLPVHQLPAANALSIGAMNLSITVGPVLAGFIVDVAGYAWAYGIDVVLFSTAMWGILELDPVPPLRQVTQKVHGWRAVRDGFSFLGSHPNVRMTFIADLCAMILARPHVLFPAVGMVYLGGTATTVGVLSAALAAGAILAMVVSGPLGMVIRQGRAIVISVIGWGISMTAAGAVLLALVGGLHPTVSMVLLCICLGIGGAFDSVSSVFRTTILQAASPDHMRGRLQAMFTVVVAGGPRLGELVMGAVGTALTESWALVVGGVACVGALAIFTVTHRGFWAYDSRDPQP